MDLKQLRYFIKIVETGSISRAALGLRLAQPALSQALRALENELGVQLVVRHPRGVTANETGLLLLEQARSILREVDRIRDLVTDHAENPSGEVRVGLPASAARGLTVPLVQAVESTYPNVELHIVDAMSATLYEWIQTGQLDLALTYSQEYLAYRSIGPRITRRPFMVEDLCLIRSHNGKLPKAQVIRFRDIAEYPLVVPSGAQAVRFVLERTAAKADTRLNVRFTLDSVPSIIELVRRGYCTILPVFAVSQEIAAGELRAFSFVDPPMTWDISVVLAPRGVLSPTTQAVMTLMENVIVNMVKRGEWPARLI